MNNRKIDVLHIVDRTSGGVPVAVADYVRNSPPDFAHTVLIPFDDAHPPATFSDVPAQLLDLGQGHFERIRKIRSVVRTMDFTVVHAHSSFAGGYTRLALRRSDATIIYSPHCFGFARRDITRLERSAYHGIEWLLGLNTDKLGACSINEQRQSEGMRTLRGKTVHVPNVSSIPLVQHSNWDGVRPLRVAMIGRISEQKDPAYFLESVGRLQARVAVEPLWIGSGTADQVAALRAAGARVTGWLSPSGIAKALSDVDVYIHSAAWEGFPISVLDANRSRTAVLVRRIDAFNDVPSPLSIEIGMEDLLASLSSKDMFGDWAHVNLQRWDSLLQDNSAAKQRDALRVIWATPPSKHRPRVPENGMV